MDSPIVAASSTALVAIAGYSDGRPRRFRTSTGSSSATGEHGVGMEKNGLMAKQFTPESLEMMRKLRALFDPDNRLNPGKMLPTGRGCAEIRQ